MTIYGVSGLVLLRRLLLIMKTLEDGQYLHVAQHIPDIGTPASFELVWYHEIIEMTNSNLKTYSNANKFPNVLTLNYILARVLQEEETKV